MNLIKALILDSQPILRKQSIDMIILDVELNDSSGLDFIQRIQKRVIKAKFCLFLQMNILSLVIRPKRLELMVTYLRQRIHR